MHGRGSSLVVYAKLQVRLEVHWLSGWWVGGWLNLAQCSGADVLQEFLSQWEGGAGGLQNNHTWRMVTFHRDCKLDSTKVFAYFLSLTLFICAAAN